MATATLPPNHAAGHHGSSEMVQQPILEKDQVDALVALDDVPVVVVDMNESDLAESPHSDELAHDTLLLFSASDRCRL